MRYLATILRVFTRLKGLCQRTTSMDLLPAAQLVLTQYLPPLLPHCSLANLGFDVLYASTFPTSRSYPTQ